MAFAQRSRYPGAVRPVVFLQLLVVAALSTACATSVHRGSDLYKQERYVEAAEVFANTEQQLATATPVARAKYAVFRGLTLLELGDYAGAYQWMQRAYEVERRHPGVLSAARRGRLDQGWAAVGARREPGPDPVVRQTAEPTEPGQGNLPLPGAGDSRRSLVE